MKKSQITDFFLTYFEKNRIEKEWISEKTGINANKLSADYKGSLTADEFLKLCALLQIEPEEIMEVIKGRNRE